MELFIIKPIDGSATLSHLWGFSKSQSICLSDLCFAAHLSRGSPSRIWGTPGSSFQSRKQITLQYLILHAYLFWS